MIKWKNASTDDLRRLRAINILFDGNSRFIEFLFHPKKAILSDSPENLKRKMGVFSSGEQTLLLIAMDVWGTYGGLHFDELYRTLDRRSLNNCIKALNAIINS